ncbi:alpha-L-fucosidase [Pedobacter frigoris]|uniref:alpha-L-fucosidase n=1 Tax=Pedobacter frigoris TaxID=2571272 RepID=UPI00292D5B21|nr:alpha-L-fucosidase [Pedobacter frigoris]
MLVKQLFRKTGSTLFLTVLLSVMFSDDLLAQEVRPNKQQLEWADAEIGAIFHLDVINYVPEYNWRKWGTHPPASVFNPSKLNTDQWVLAAKASGATYAVLVAKHCSGFSLWPTKAHDYSVKSSPWKNGNGDVVKDFIASCKKYGVKPGIYASAAANGYYYVDNPGKVVASSPYTQAAYNKMVETQLTELWTNYGKLFEIWFDGGVMPRSQGGPDIVPLLKKLQSDAIVFQGPVQANNLIRWIGNEEGVAPYPNWSRADSTTSATGTIKVDDMSGNPNGPIWCPGEADFPLRRGWQGGWFWKEGQKMRSLEDLLRNYDMTVGRNSNMLIGIVVDTSGLVPQEDFARLKEFGEAVKSRYSKPLAKVSSKQELQSLSLGKEMTIKTIIIEEDISNGEHIREYILEAKVNNQWVKIAEGSSVGHKRIQSFDPISVKDTRLRITKASGKVSFTYSLL